MPPPLPLPEALPSRVEQYGPSGHWPLAPPEFWSACDVGCGWVESPVVLALPALWSLDPLVLSALVDCVVLLSLAWPLA